MIIAGLDLETTGLLQPEHRIIEIYIGFWHLESQGARGSYEQRIDPQRSIALEAQRVHGISSTALVGKPTFEVVGPKISDLLAEADLIVGHNIEGFDKPFLDMELKRVGAPPVTAPVFDTMLLGRHGTPNGKVPTLGELCFAYDVPYDASALHTADRDVNVMVQCLFKGLSWGFFTLPDLIKKDTAIAA